jgi:hypothetical protein
MGLVRSSGATGRFKAFSLKADATGAVSLGVEVEPIRGASLEDLSALFEVMGETARELGIGALILVDELQEAEAAELAAINTALHHLGQAEVQLSLMLVGAGLPSLPWAAPGPTRPMAAMPSLRRK